MDSITILIADDHPPFRAGLRALLEFAQNITVVGEAGTGIDTVAQAAKLQPDVILMDIQMPDMNGIDATRRILHTSPHVAILILTMFEDDDFVFSALKAGARGYLLKGTPKAEISLGDPVGRQRRGDLRRGDCSTVDDLFRRNAASSLAANLCLSRTDRTRTRNTSSHCQPSVQSGNCGTVEHQPENSP